MSQAIPTAVKDCCTPVCTDEGVAIPGPAGATGASGSNGTNGANSYTTLSAGFTMPASGANVTITVGTTAWMVAKTSGVGDPIIIGSAGKFEVQSITDSTHAVVKNLGYSENVAPGTVIANGQGVAPCGFNGTNGTNGSNSFPTTTKGDLMADNGAGGGSASVVRVAVGTNGKALTANSTSGAGVSYATITPNGTATPSDSDNRIARFNGATGNEVPLPTQLSSVLVTDDGALQTVGGDPRGNNAVDLQTVRTAPTQVASGVGAFLGSGDSNTASATNAAVVAGSLNEATDIGAFVGGGHQNYSHALYSTIPGGTSNAISGDYGTIGGGNSNTVAGTYATVAGGGTNQAQGDFSAILGGASNVATTDNSIVLGGSTNTAGAPYAMVGGQQCKTQTYGAEAFSAGVFANDGDAQRAVYKVRKSTSNATPTKLYCNGVLEQIKVPANRTVQFNGWIVGRSSTGDTATWKVEGLIKNNGGTTALVGTPTITIPYVDAAITGTWGVAGSVTATADNVNDCLDFNVTGAAATNIRWHGVIFTNELEY